MATFSGIDLGLIEEMITMPNPKERQLNSYPGVGGLEALDMGARGLVTSCRGVVAAFDPPSLAAIHLQFIILQQGGQPAALFDVNGTNWLDVVLVGYRPVGPRMPAPTFADDFGNQGGICQRYQADFLHPDALSSVGD